MKTIKSLLLSVAIMFTGVLFAQDYKADVNKSEIKWTGKKVTGQHWGYVKLKEGTLKMKDGNIVEGMFTIDMNSINVKDIEDPETNKKLEGHLKSDDFFGVKTHPTAKFHITKATPFKEYSSQVEGKITIKGKTEPIKFDVKQARDAYIATITIDRSKFDVRYGSGSFFDNLGDNLIYDDFTLNVKLYLK
jgi:polyisoprenoid-binding protein YceI